MDVSLLFSPKLESSSPQNQNVLPLPSQKHTHTQRTHHLLVALRSHSPRPPPGSSHCPGADPPALSEEHGGLVARRDTSARSVPAPPPLASACAPAPAPPAPRAGEAAAPGVLCAGVRSAGAVCPPERGGRAHLRRRPSFEATTLQAPAGSASCTAGRQPSRFPRVVGERTARSQKAVFPCGPS